MCEQDQLAFWTKLLNLDGFQVVYEERTAADEPRRNRRHRYSCRNAATGSSSDARLAG